MKNEIKFSYTITATAKVDYDFWGNLGDVNEFGEYETPAGHRITPRPDEVKSSPTHCVTTTKKVSVSIKKTEILKIAIAFAVVLAAFAVIFYKL